MSDSWVPVTEVGPDQADHSAGRLWCPPSRRTPTCSGSGSELQAAFAAHGAPLRSHPGDAAVTVASHAGPGAVVWSVGRVPASQGLQPCGIPRIQCVAQQAHDVSCKVQAPKREATASVCTVQLIALKRRLVDRQAAPAQQALSTSTQDLRVGIATQLLTFTQAARRTRSRQQGEH